MLKNYLTSYAQNSLNDKIENILQKYLKIYFIVIFITTLAGAYEAYLSHHIYKMGDWLINYQGGMVRRGFVGELAFQISLLTNINPGIYIFVFQALLYTIFLLFAYLLLKQQQFLLPYSLLVLSPFIFTFQINDLLGGFRKEILYIATLAFITWSAVTKETKIFERTFYIILLVYPLIILTHEMLAIFLPYLLIIYISVVPLTTKRVLLTIALLLPSIGGGFVSLYYSGSESNIHAIISSLSAQNYAINSGGAISFLDRNTAYGIKIVQHQWYNNRYYLFIIPLAMATIAYIPIYQKLMYIIKNRLSALLLLATIIGSIALFAVAIDWGRFIYIHLVSLFLLSFISPNKTQNHFVWFSDKLKIKTVFIFLIIYSTLWHIPHAGSVFAKTFRQPAFIALVTPYAKIVRYYLS